MKSSILSSLGLCLLSVSLPALAHNTVPATTISPSHEKTDNPTKKYTLTGIVRDHEGLPLAGANVRISGSTQSVGTDQDGKFCLLVAQKGERHILVSHVGYKTISQLVNLSTNNSPLQFQLSLAQTDIEESVVTGTHYERPLKDVPVITRVISRSEIERINPIDMQQLMQYSLPGMQFTFNNHNGSSYLSYQGMSSRTVVFLVDGERMNGEGSDQNIDFNRLNPDEVERIEIIRGAASSLYDSNAMGGVINIITKRASRPLSINMNGRYAGTDGQKYGLQLGVKRSNFSSYTTLGRRERDSYTVQDDKGAQVEVQDTAGNRRTNVEQPESSTIMGYSILDASQRFVYNPTEKWSIELKGAYYNNTQPKRNEGKRYDQFENINFGTKSTYLINEQQKLEIAYNNDLYTKYYHYPIAKTKETPYKSRLQNSRINYSSDFEGFSLLTGMEWYNEDLLHYFWTQKDNASKSGTKWSWYLQDDFSVNENLKVIASLRLEKAYSYNLRYLPKFSILYRPSENLTLRANLSDGFRAPSLKERFQDYIPVPGHIPLLGNPDLLPEESRQVSASLDYQYGNFSLMANGYYNTYDHYIGFYVETHPDTHETIGQYHNSESKKTAGVEITARYQTADWLLTTTYNYINDYEQKNGYNISNIRPHALTFGASYRYRFSSNLHFLSSLNGSWGVAFDTYQLGNGGKSYVKYHYDARTILSLNLGVQLPKNGLTASLQIDNLLDYHDKAATAATQLPNPGRIYALSLNMNLNDLLKF